MPRVSRNVLLLAGMALAPQLAAQFIDTQHAVDMIVPVAKRLEVTWHTRIRNQTEGRGFYQLRTGPVIDYKLHRQVSLLAGTYFTQVQRAEGWTTINRPFAGAQVTLSRRPLEVDLRALAERHIQTGYPEFARYRERLRISATSRVAPYASVEFFQDRQGWRSIRYMGGVRSRSAGSLIVDTGYFYEWRRADQGGPRQIFLTGFQFRTPRLFGLR